MTEQRFIETLVSVSQRHVQNSPCSCDIAVHIIFPSSLGSREHSFVDSLLLTQKFPSLAPRGHRLSRSKLFLVLDRSSFVSRADLKFFGAQLQLLKMSVGKIYEGCENFMKFRAKTMIRPSRGKENFSEVLKNPNLRY